MHKIFNVMICLFFAAETMAYWPDMAEKGGVAHQLFTGKKQLHAWADELEKAQPETLAEVWDAMEVLLRAERYEALTPLIPLAYQLSLKTNALEKYDARRSMIAVWLCRLPPEHGKLCIAFFEMFGAVLSLYDAMFPYEINSNRADALLKFMQAEKWSPEQIADWVYNRYQAALAFDVQKEKKSFERASVYPMSSIARYWENFYFQQLLASPEKENVFNQIRNDARESPNDMKKMAFFLSSIRHAGGIGANDAEWLLTAFKQRAYGSWVIGGLLKTKMYVDGNEVREARMEELKEAFLRQALSTPLTAEECDRVRAYLQGMSSMMQPERSDELICVIFSVQVMDDLNELYLELNRGEEAQRVMLQARELRKKHNLGEGNFLAGATQGMSGARVVEAEIIAREEADETNPSYWIERAHYYKGRKEDKEEEDALRRALALFDVTKTDPSIYPYRHVFSGLFNFLWNRGRHDEAMELFKTQRAAARHNASVLGEMYYVCRKTISDANRFNEIEPGLVEDLRDAYEFLKTPREDADQAYLNMFSSNKGLLRSYASEAIRAHVLDFKNDPFAWDALAMFDHPFYFNVYLKMSLFPNDDNTLVLDEHAIEKLKDLSTRKLLNFNQLNEISDVLRDAKNYETANWFLLAAVERGKYDSHTEQCYIRLIDNYEIMGDWRNSQKYIDMVAELKQFHVKALALRLRTTAFLAEKNGELEVAEQMRERAKNLGKLP